MQTFVPYTDNKRSAKTLDLQRLGKQIMECGQILRALTVPSYGWKNHPATRMWSGYEPQLFRYAMDMSTEWYDRRGKRHGATDRIIDEFCGPPSTIRNITSNGDGPLPEWWGSYIHVTHQSNLVRKDPEHYRRYFPFIKDDLDYYWPVDQEILAQDLVFVH